jgi:putative transposase
MFIRHIAPSPGTRSMVGMPRRLHRCYGLGYLHYITSSCYRRRAFLNTARRRTLFLEILEQVRRRYNFVVVGYVVMPEHFHLMISEPEQGNPSTVMQVLKQRFARKVLTEWRKRNQGKPDRLWIEGFSAGHVWQRRFYDFTVWTKAKREEKLHYMHRNPVERGLVLEPEQWAWSSSRHYAHGESGRVLVNQRQHAPMRLRRVVNGERTARAG